MISPLWTQERDLPDVYVSLARAQGGLPARWQVLRPGSCTGVGPGADWQGSNQTFALVSISIAERNAKEKVACAWATTHFGPVQWVRIEGLDLVLFPLSVAQQLRRHIPDLNIAMKSPNLRASDAS